MIEANVRQANPMVGNVMCHPVVFINEFTICQWYQWNWTKVANKLPNISNYTLNDTSTYVALATNLVTQFELTN